MYEFAKEWVEAGHEVTVVSSVYSKSDIRASKFIEDQYFDGIHVKVLNLLIDNKHSFMKRIWSFVVYSMFSCYYALTLKADIVIASSGPITVGLPGLIAKYLGGRKLIFETRDLWPEGAIELGIIKNHLVKRVAYWFEKRCYKAASFIITLSPGMTQNIRQRMGLKNVADVSNAANIDLFSTPSPRSISNLLSKSYAIYTGNIGMVNNSYWLYNAAKALKERGRDDIKIVLVGEGQQREELEERAIEEEVFNFIRLGLMSKKDLVSYIQNALVSLVPLKGTPVLDTSSPNKFFESLAAGVPIIQNTQGWMKDFLLDHEVGFTLNPDDPEELADKLVWVKDHSSEVTDMGIRAKVIARELFDKNYLANKMLNIIKDVHARD